MELWIFYSFIRHNYNHIWLLQLKIFTSGELHFCIRQSKHTWPSVSHWMQLKTWLELVAQQFEDSEKSIVAGGLEKTRIWSTAISVPWPGRSAAHTWMWAPGMDRESSRRNPPVLTWVREENTLLTLRERGIETSSFKKFPSLLSGPSRQAILWCWCWQWQQQRATDA